jgi:uncharacterized protein YkvS
MVGHFEIGDQVQDKYGEHGTVSRVNERTGIVVVTIPGLGNQYYVPEDLTLLYRGEEGQVDILSED